MRVRLTLSLSPPSVCNSAYHDIKAEDAINNDSVAFDLEPLAQLFQWLLKCLCLHAGPKNRCTRTWITSDKEQWVYTHTDTQTHRHTHTHQDLHA